MSADLVGVNGSDAVFRVPEGLLGVRKISDSILRVRCTAEAEFSSRESIMVVPRRPPMDDLRVDRDPGGFEIRAGRIVARVGREDGTLSFTDGEGGSLLNEARGGRRLEKKDVRLSVFDGGTRVTAVEGVDGVSGRVDEVRSRVDRCAYRAVLGFSFAEGESIYGFGSHEEGYLDYRGRRQYLYQQNMKVVIPVMLSSKGYGILFENYSPMVFDDTGEHAVLSMETVDEIDYYVIAGPSFDEIVRGIRDLTGTAVMLPRWAFGYIQSKERYVDAAELVSVVREYRRRGIPLDGIVLDWRSWTGDLWGDKNLDPERFPDPDRMTGEIHGLGARMMISIWPHMRGDGANRREMLEAGYLLGNEATYDAFDEEARWLYWDQANRGLFSHGIDAWWCDCTEPFEADWRGAVKPDPEERMRINTAEQEKFLDPQLVNAYSLLHSRGIYEGQRSVTDAKRVVNLTRSGYPGQQRYGTVVWSGDIAAKWDVLRTQIAEGLNFCAAGMPYWTLDIGGFFVTKREQWFWNGDYPEGTGDLGYRELYVRWFQYGAFLPMFRSHGTDTPREVWRFGEPGEPMYDALVDFDYLRYRLMPYLYSCAWRVTRDGYTLMRMLAFDFREDPAAARIEDQYMFGPSIMVCPVTRPMYYGPGSEVLEGVPKTREVYLPSGTDWYDFWTGERYGGGRRIEAVAPIGIIPLYVRAGSVIPMGPRIQHTGEDPGGTFEIRVYPGADGKFTVFDDAGDGYGYERGECAEYDISWDDNGGRLTLSERRGSFPGMTVSRDVRFVPVGKGGGAGIAEGTGVRECTYKGERISL